MNKNKSGIYQIVNLTNGKRYIGSAVNLKKRKESHFSNLKRNEHPNKHLQNSYNKHGEHNFIFEVLLFCNTDELLYYEQMKIDSYDNNMLYNKRIIAKSNLGLKFSEETRNKISNSNKGRECSIETRKKIGIAHKGRKHSENTKQRLREIMKEEFRTGKRKPFSCIGLKQKPETIKKRSEKLKGRKVSEETRNKIRQSNIGINSLDSLPIYQIDKNTDEIIKKWINAREASEALKISRSFINKVCNKYKYHKTAGGFKWIFVKDYENKKLYN